MSVLLEACHIGRRDPDGRQWLLRDVSFELRAGEAVGLVGPSGAGKTLLLRSLVLLDSIDAGLVRWKGDEPAPDDVPAFRRAVLYLHQQPVVFAGDVLANLRIPFDLATNRTRRFEQDRAVELLEELGRDESFLRKPAESLSGGESRIIALVRALLLEPEILLLDEPVAALDPDSAAGVERVVRAWRSASAGRAFVWVHHDADTARRMTDRIACLRDGRTGTDGS